MTQTFVEGTRVPVTRVMAGPCVVTQIKKEDKDGYWGVQLGFSEKRIKNVTKPMQGHLKGVTKEKMAPRFLREVRLKKATDFKVGELYQMKLNRARRLHLNFDAHACGEVEVGKGVYRAVAGVFDVN